jgi:hypothetical protein
MTPLSTENAHREKHALNFNQIFYTELERTVSNDWCIRFGGLVVQILKQSNYAPAKAKVNVRITFDKKISVFYRGFPIKFRIVNNAHINGLDTLNECDFATLV